MDKSENYKITKKDMESLEYLIVNGYCTSLKGIEYAKNLTKFGVKLFDVTDLSPLKNLTKIESLSISGISKVKNLDALKNMVNMNFLGIFDCYELTNIDAIGNFTKLTTLSLLSTTKLTSIEPLKNLKNLEVLTLKTSAVKDLSSNKLQSIKGLKLSNSVKEFRIDHNNITDFSPLSSINKNTTVYAFAQVVSGGRTTVNFEGSYSYKLPEITDIDGIIVKISKETGLMIFKMSYSI